MMGSAYSYKIGRNQPCPCGSGKKYKKCCGRDTVKKLETSFADKSAAIIKAIELHQLGQFNKSYELCLNVLKSEPDSLAAIELVITMLMRAKQFSQASNLLEKAIHYSPSQSEFYYLLSSVRKAQYRIEDAIACLNKTIEINSNFIEAYINRANALGLQGMVDEAISDYRNALKLNPDFDLAHMNLLFMLNFSTTYSEHDISKEHKLFGKHLESQFDVDASSLNKINCNKEKLRIGYISSDFYTHSVSYYIHPVLSNHNHSHFEIFGYYTNTIADKFTERISGLCDNWKNVAGYDDQSLENLIRGDEIDILVDLSGYTANSRVQLFARKPAPVQITWLGYPNTTGLRRIDYRLTDAIADPEDSGADNQYSEQLYRLPKNFSVYQPPDPCPNVADLPCTRSGVVTFGSFNNFSKTNPLVIELWSSVLNQIPKSRLLLKNHALVDISMRKRVHDAFFKHGITADRVMLRGRDQDVSSHLSQYAQVDIGLDPFPYNGTTTTCEALWMGVPVITLAGSSHRARVGTSLLTTIGRKEWIAENKSDYIAIAKNLVNDLEALKKTRLRLRNDIAESPLTDAKGFTFTLENAYRDIWEKCMHEPVS
jgi:predicted O-linked N-acetylglucosamine transferase (SPINDLY family)